MSAAESEKILPAEETDTGTKPHLLLLKNAPAPAEPTRPVETGTQETGEEQEEGGPGAVTRAWLWFREEWREIFGPLQLRKFITDSIEDMAAASRYLPGLAYEWVLEPDPRTDKSAYKKMGLRLLVVTGPPAGAVFVMLRPGGEIVVPAALLGWLLASWMVADDARADAKLRQLAKKKKTENAEYARLLHRAKRHGLTPAEVEELLKEEKNGKKEVPLEQSPAEGAPRPWTQEDINRYVWNWVREQIGEKNGIHLDELFRRAQEKKGPPRLVEPTTTQAQFRQGLEYRLVTVGQVKVNGVNRTGVKRSDVPGA